MGEVAFELGHRRRIRFWEMNISNSDEGNGTSQRRGDLIANIYRGFTSLDRGFLNIDIQL